MTGVNATLIRMVTLQDQKGGVHERSNNRMLLYSSTRGQGTDSLQVPTINQYSPTSSKRDPYNHHRSLCYGKIVNTQKNYV